MQTDHQALQDEDEDGGLPEEGRTDDQIHTTLELVSAGVSAKAAWRSRGDLAVHAVALLSLFSSAVVFVAAGTVPGAGMLVGTVVVLRLLLDRRKP